MQKYLILTITALYIPTCLTMDNRQTTEKKATDSQKAFNYQDFQDSLKEDAKKYHEAHLRRDQINKYLIQSQTTAAVSAVAAAYAQHTKNPKIAYCIVVAGGIATIFSQQQIEDHAEALQPPWPYPPCSIM